MIHLQIKNQIESKIKSRGIVIHSFANHWLIRFRIKNESKWIANQASLTLDYSLFNYSNRYFLRKKFKVQFFRILVQPVVWCKLVEPGRCGRLKTCTLCAAQSRLASKTIILLKFSSPQTPRKFKLTQNFGKKSCKFLNFCGFVCDRLCHFQDILQPANSM